MISARTLINIISMSRNVILLAYNFGVGICYAYELLSFIFIERSTIIVGSIIGDLSSLYLEKKSDAISAQLIRRVLFLALNTVTRTLSSNQTSVHNFFWTCIILLNFFALYAPIRAIRLNVSSIYIFSSRKYQLIHFVKPSTQLTTDFCLFRFRSTTYIHKCDLFELGRINESDYVLFKLQQLQMLDFVMLRRLTNRFSELDIQQRRLLIIGQDIPSAEQVKKLQKTIKGTSMTLMNAWRTMRLGLIREEDDDTDEVLSVKSDEEGTAIPKAQKKAEYSAGLLSDYVRGKASKRPKRVSDVHDFAWSRKLWKYAAYHTLAVASFLLVVYVIVGWNFLVDNHSRSRLWKAYFLSATLSTVGLGDIAPTTQDTRLAAVFLLPLGLIIIGFLLSFSTALEKSRMPSYRGASADSPREVEARALFDALDEDGNGVLTEEECIAGAKKMFMTEQQARNLYKDLDPEGIGAVEAPVKHPKPWRYTVSGKCWILFFKMYGLVAIGAIYFKIWEDGRPDMSWIDAAYFATVVSTSIGYGDIVPESDGGRLFMSIYMLLAAGIVGDALSDLTEVYVNDVVGEKIVQTLFDSTTWIHKADIDKRGVITEADYVLFKLQQLMKVDAAMLDTLIDRFEELDDNSNGWLDIGIEVPSAEQVAEMKEELSVKLGLKTLVDAWEDKRKAMDIAALKSAAIEASEQTIAMHRLHKSTKPSNVSAPATVTIPATIEPSPAVANPAIAAPSPDVATPAAAVTPTAVAKSTSQSEGECADSLSRASSNTRRSNSSRSKPTRQADKEPSPNKLTRTSISNESKNFERTRSVSVDRNPARLSKDPV